MNCFLSIGFTGIFFAIFYGLAHWESKKVLENSLPIPKSELPLGVFLQNPQATDDLLPPLIDHAVKGHTPGLAPEAVCFYAKLLHPNEPQFYSIWSEHREVYYQCL
jgi:hypothetical protein